jgi:hypothetical protein
MFHTNNVFIYYFQVNIIISSNFVIIFLNFYQHFYINKNKSKVEPGHLVTEINNRTETSPFYMKVQMYTIW